jgi:hypothetical protein
VWAFGVALVVWAGAGLLARRPGWPLARGAAILAGLAAACGGVWYARNWVESGNPAFPVKVELFGVTVLDAPRDTAREAAGFTIAGYLDDPSVWREHLLDTYLQILGPPALMLVLGALAAAVVASRRPRDGRALALAAASALLAVAYALTPYSAQGAQGFPVFAGPNTRYALPALLAAAPLAALALGRLGARRPWAGAAVQVLALVAVGDGLRRAFDVGAVRLLAGAAVVASAAALAAAVRAGSRRLPASARAPAAAGAAVLALAGLGAAARHDEREFDRGRYRAVDATFDWVLRNAPAHRRIALAGNWSHGIAPPFPMFGPRLRNRVAFHGRWVERMLQPHRAPGPFLRDLRAGGYDLLVVGRGFDAALGAPPAGDVREERWARNAGLRPVARSDTLTLFAVGR